MPNGKPNILILWGDDIGQSNLSCYSHGLMGYQTPNIDRIASEGAKFIHYYAEQSCTAGRAAFITGQSVYRTGLSKVGLPGAELGFRAEDPTIGRTVAIKTIRLSDTASEQEKKFLRDRLFREARAAGKTKFSGWKLWNFALEGSPHIFHQGGLQRRLGAGVQHAGHRR